MALFARIKDWTSNEVLTEPDLEAESDNIINNLVPLMIEDYSATLAQMQNQTDPYPASVASRPTNLAGEQTRLRYQIAQITGKSYWYEDSPGSFTSHSALHNPQGADSIKTLYRRPFASDTTFQTETSTSFALVKRATFYLDRTNLADIRKIHAMIGMQVDNAANTATAQLKVGGVTDATFTTNSTSYVYELESVDVSGLTDLTLYNVDLELKITAGTVTNFLFDIWFE